MRDILNRYIISCPTKSIIMDLPTHRLKNAIDVAVREYHIDLSTCTVRMWIHPADVGSSILNVAHYVTQRALRTIESNFGERKNVTEGNSLTDTNVTAYNHIRRMAASSQCWNPDYPDVEDMIDEVAETIHECYRNGMTIEATYRMAYKAANSMVYNNKKRTSNEISLQCFVGDGVDIVSVSRQIARVIDGKRVTITPTDDDSVREYRRSVMSFVGQTVRNLSPAQTDLVIARANAPHASNVQLGEMLGKNESTVRRTSATVCVKGFEILNSSSRYNKIRIDRPGLEKSLYRAEKTRERDRIRKANGKKVDEK